MKPACSAFAKSLALLLAILAAGLAPMVKAADTALLADLAPQAALMPCADLAAIDLAGATGAPTTIAAQTVSGPQPTCKISGTIAPSIRFEVRLPITGWTQRYLQTGCGGLCGNLRIDAGKSEGCAPVTDGSIVLASTDMGHQGMDPAWGQDPQKREDFAHRSVHVTALAAKALMKAFYGQPQRYAYFSGCSDGGREALIEAQRYPEDFDGIAAGAPAMYFSVQNSFHHSWLARANTGAEGRPILTAPDLPLLHAAVLAACDRLDGLADGQITDPRACHYDPARLGCKAAYVQGQCLTPAQVQAVRMIYQGARSQTGKPLEVGPLMRGSEGAWNGVFVPANADGPIFSARIALDTINNLLFTPNPAQPYTVQSFPFTQAMSAMQGAARQLYNAENADLSGFTARKGKLILWHGWSDPHITPLGTIAYFDHIGRKMGTAARDDAVRLFLFPAMGHCSGGDGPNEFPLLASLMAWVETGHAPQMIVAHRAAQTRAGLPARSRPVYAYPAVATYKGTGSLDEAGNFRALSR